MFFSADTTDDQDDAARFKCLNSLTPAGLPPHRLILKKTIMLILLRNLNTREGLCSNCTRLIPQGASNHLLHCKIASGEPRITLSCKDGYFPFSWKRMQFPVRPVAFAMTIKHKSKLWEASGCVAQ